jgi:hypothetical protein
VQEVWIYKLRAMMGHNCVICGVICDGPSRHLCDEHRHEYHIRVFSETHPAPPGALIEWDLPKYLS